MKFINYLTQKQIKLNLSQNKFADYLQTDKAVLSRIITGTRKPSSSFIYRVCNKFGDDNLITEFICEKVK